MLVTLRQPTRSITVGDVSSVNALLDRLELNREAHLVLRNGTLVPGDAALDDSDEIEVRPVISGGA